MKKITSLFVALMFATFSMSASADCGGETCVEVDPVMSNLLTIDITSLGAVAGVGEINGIGTEFAGRVDKDSTLLLDTWVGGDTDLCGSDCTDFSVYFEGQAIENITSIGAAISTTPGEAAGVSNASQALSQLGLSIDIGGTLVEGDGG